MAVWQDWKDRAHAYRNLQALSASEGSEAQPSDASFARQGIARLRQEASIAICNVALLRPIQAFQYVFPPDVKIFLAASTGFLGDPCCEENDSGSPALDASH